MKCIHGIDEGVKCPPCRAIAREVAAAYIEERYGEIISMMADEAGAGAPAPRAASGLRTGTDTAPPDAWAAPVAAERTADPLDGWAKQ